MNLRTIADAAARKVVAELGEDAPWIDLVDETADRIWEHMEDDSDSTVLAVNSAADKALGRLIG